MRCRVEKKRTPLIYCAYEKLKVPVPYLPDIKVVEQIYTATVCDDPPRAENLDHISIVKPAQIEPPRQQLLEVYSVTFCIG